VWGSVGSNGGLKLPERFGELALSFADTTTTTETTTSNVSSNQDVTADEPRSTVRKK